MSKNMYFVSYVKIIPWTKPNCNVGNFVRYSVVFLNVKSASGKLKVNNNRSRQVKSI